MLKRVAILLAIAGLAGSAGLPLWALNACEEASVAAPAEHACCQRHPAQPTPPKAPSGACILHCSGSVGVLEKAPAPPQPERSAGPAVVLQGAGHDLIVAAPGFAPTETIFDSSGLHQRVRVLRI